MASKKKADCTPEEWAAHIDAARTKYRERYQNDPEFRERMKKRQRDLRSDPNFKATEKAYRARPDVRAKRSRANREYVKRESVKDKKREWNATSRRKPEAIAKARERQRAKLGFKPGMADVLMTIQGGRCAVCGTPFKKTPCADHCHDSGVARGLLCALCNTFEGRLKRLGMTPEEYASRLRAYLENPPAVTAAVAMELAG